VEGAVTYLTVRDVADRFQVSPRTVERLIGIDLLRAVRIGRQVRIRPADLPEKLPETPRPSRRVTTLPPSGVYMLFQDEALVYVGRSTELPRRITNHRRAGRQFDEVRAIPCDPSTADWLEGELIRTLRPPANIKRFERRARRVDAALAAMAL
jgi:excisionase family DNA binding protein